MTVIRPEGLRDPSPLVNPTLTPPRFIADTMLGSLVLWLRLMGFDTLIHAAKDDNALLRSAASSGRILLTAHRALAARPLARNVILLPPTGPRRQLEQLARFCPLHRRLKPFSRCPRCNNLLRPVDKDRVREQLPPYIWEQYERFSRCTSCGRIYWPGSHRSHALGKMMGGGGMGKNCELRECLIAN